jgi:hypothetical protein
LIICENIASSLFTQANMPKFDVRQSRKLNLTSYAVMALIGQCCKAAQVDRVIDPRLPVSQDMKTCSMAKAMTGLLSLCKSDFEAIEPLRGDRFFKEALGLSKVPSSAWMRQRLDAKASALRELTDEVSVRLLSRTEASITPYQCYVRFEIDTFAMDNSDTQKEYVSQTYQGFDGYCPLPATWATKVGTSDWNCVPATGIPRWRRRFIATSGCTITTSPRRPLGMSRPSRP